MSEPIFYAILSLGWKIDVSDGELTNRIHP